MPDLVLVATDGGRTATNALEFAAAYADAKHVAIEVVAVVEPLSDLPMPLPHREELEHAHARGVAERVRERLRQVVGPVDWPVHLRLGRPAPAICQTASARRAGMIVLGLDGRKDDGNSSAVELVHLSEIPVLVARGPAVPRAVLVGVDFRPSSVRAARQALGLVGPHGVLHLVHVEPSLDFPAASVWDWTGWYGSAVSKGFEQLVAELESLGATDVRTQTRTGDPVVELLHAAAELHVDLLAIGGDGYICNGRAVVGRVARRLMADPPLSLLATPVRTTSDGTVVHVSSARAVPEPVTT